MAQITNYSTLQTEVANVLNRDDLTADIPGFIQSAEARLKRDHRAKLLVDATPLSTTASTETTTLASDVDSIEALAHDGPTYFGEIDIVDPGKLSDWLGHHGGTTGVPAYAALSEVGTTIRLRWAPVPDAQYDLLFQYWAKLTNLSSASPVNRFLQSHPDIYLYAALVESAPFLKDDDRLPMWETILSNRLDDLHRSTQRRTFSGSLVRKPKLVIP